MEWKEVKVREAFALGIYDLQETLLAVSVEPRLRKRLD